MSKQDPYRFNLRFDDTDSDHQKVCDFLNSCGRKKTRYIAKAFLAYWGMAGAKGPEEQRKETMEPKPPEEEHLKRSFESYRKGTSCSGAAGRLHQV